MNTTVSRPRFSSWIPAYPVGEHIVFATLLWAAFFAAVMAVVGVISIWVNIRASVWDYAGNAVLWYGFAIGIYLGWSVLPLHVTHGRTRRQFFAHALVFVAAFAVALALLNVAGYWLEAALYQIAGWEQRVGDPLATLELASRTPELLVHALLRCALWVTGGLFIAACWYREDGLGALALVPATLLGGLSGVALDASAPLFPLGPAFRTVWERVLAEPDLHLLAATAVHLLCTAILLGLTWLAVRGVPIRNKKA